jgi:hypothetical protein
MHPVYIVVEHMAKKIKHNDLTHYFLRDHKDLPPAYLASCRKFFDSICWPDYYGGGPDTKHKIFRLRDYKPQAASHKPQAASCDNLSHLHKKKSR